MDLQDKHISVWNNCLKMIEQLVEPQQFQTWFTKIKPVSLVESTLTVEVPTDFFRQYIEDAFLDVIKISLKRELGAGAKLMYSVRTVSGQPQMKISASDNVAPTNRPVSISGDAAASNPGAFVYAGLQNKVRINPRLNPIYSFSNLVKGDCNSLAVSVARSISAAPGETSFNPLFIFGGPGLGKTHIAQAIGLSVKELFPDKIVLYVTGNEFKLQYMDAVYVHNKVADFIAFYQKIDVLIVDDIQDLLGPGSQTAFFNIFNALHQNRKQLIFTSDRAPAELHNFEERLRSRFKWGVSVELSLPDYNTRLLALKARCLREGMLVGDEVLSYLASHVKSNFRDLEGALITLMAHSAIAHTETDVALAEDVVRKIVGEEKRDISIERVQEAVCEYFAISHEDLVSKSRRRQIVQARQIAMYLSRALIPNCSLSLVGEEIGGKNHATVLHSCNTVADLMQTDKLFKKYVSDIERQIVSSVR